MAKPPLLYLINQNLTKNINDNGKTKIKNMYNNLKSASIYKRNFEGVSEIVRKVRIREYVQNRIVRGSNVIMSDFYCLKNHKNPS